MEVEPKRRRIRGKTTPQGIEESVVPVMKRQHRRPSCTVPRTRSAKAKAKANPHQQFGLMKDWRDAFAIKTFVPKSIERDKPSIPGGLQEMLVVGKIIIPAKSPNRGMFESM